MREITDSEARSIMLDILIDVSRFCDDNGLTYFITYGTLIGAIRHKGFIPWDDDIDIMMPRPDYEKFIKLYRVNGTYAVCSPFDIGAFLEWTKVYDNRTTKIEDGIDYSICTKLGIDIDVFPIDGQPDDEHISDYKKDCDYRMGIHKQLKRITRSLRGLSIKGKVTSICCRALGAKYYIKKYIDSASKYSYYSSAFVGFADPYSWVPYSDRHRREIFENRIKVQFEGHKFWAPAGYDEFLKKIYGDYMQLPPSEKQVKHHKYFIFWNNCNSKK